MHHIPARAVRSRAQRTLGLAGVLALGASLFGPTGSAAAAAKIGSFDFGPAGSPTASGFIPDAGQAYSPERGYGWVAWSAEGTPVTMTSAVERDTDASDRLDDFINMKAPGKPWGRWVIDVAPGLYEVTATVGDTVDTTTSTHQLYAEDVLLVPDWRASADTPTRAFKQLVTVTDGRLTLDPSEGVQTKLIAATVVALDDVAPSSTTTTTPGSSTTTTTGPGTTTTTAPRGGGAGTVGDHQVGAIAGFAPGGAFPGMPEETIIKELNDMSAAGARHLRMLFSWSTMEQRRGQYNFRKALRIAELARERGIRIIAVVAYTPPWARVGGCTDGIFCEPADVQDYANFMREVVDTFVPEGVTTYEIWNEPNMKIFWAPKPNPTKYTSLVKRAYAAAKAARPSAVILAGSFAPAGDRSNGNQIAPRTFLNTMYNQGVRGSFDALSFHPYSFPYEPMKPAEWNAFASVMPDLHQVMKDNGDGAKKIWGTEFGFPTGRHEKAVSEAEQAEMIKKSFDAWQAFPFTGVLVWFGYRDMGTDPYSYHDNFGLVRRDFTAKPALREFSRVMRLTRTGGSNRA